MGLDQLANDTGIPLALVIEAAKAGEAARHNDLLVDDGDSRDEHMGGLADPLRAIAESLEALERA